MAAITRIQAAQRAGRPGRPGGARARRRGVAGRRRPGRSGAADPQGAEGAAARRRRGARRPGLRGDPGPGPGRGARRIGVAKRKSRHSYAQDEINRLLVAFAREGLTVVRLKGGDPFIFGRGGEELEACRAAGVACHVVPGVTAALAARRGGRRAAHPSRRGPGGHLRHRPRGAGGERRTSTGRPRQGQPDGGDLHGPRPTPPRSPRA